jgi:hypothetical protein
MSDRSPIAPPAGARLAWEEEAREQQELVRTKAALVEELRALSRTRSTILDEIDVLRGEAQRLVREGTGFERFTRSNRRHFERALEREVHRTARDVNGRFSTVILSVQGRMPAWFISFLTQTMRASDLCVRADANELWVFLHAAGGLGRRVFLSRLAQGLDVAGRHHKAQLEVDVGASTFPADGDTPRALMDRARDRMLTLSARPLPAPAPGPTAGFELMPPAGLPLDEPRAARPRVLQSLEDAARDGGSGEVVVRAEDVVGRVYICRGQIAWAHCSNKAMPLTEFLIHACGADPEEVQFAYEYCKKSGGNFAETLIEFGTFTRHGMREALRRHLRAHLRAVLRLPTPEVLFLPQNRKYHSDLLFPLEELAAEDEQEERRNAIVSALKRG